MFTAAVYAMVAVVLQLLLRNLQGLRGLQIATVLACIPPAILFVFGAYIALFDYSLRDIERAYTWAGANAGAIAVAILLWSHRRLRRSFEKK